jgi:hypothetical protein
MPANISVAKAVQQIKAVSSKWLRQECGQSRFARQEGYGAFSIGAAQVNAAIAYICDQQEHHRKRDFHAEFILFLKKNGMEYGPRYVRG